MRRFVLIGGIAIAFAGCKKEQPAPGAPGAAPPAAHHHWAGEADAGFVVTPEKIDAFIAYQKKMLEVWAGTLEDLERLEGKADAGMAAVNEVVDAARRRGRAEEAAREATGLTEREVGFLEALVGDVIAKRSLGKSMNLDGLVRQIEATKAALPPEQREAVEKSIAEMKKQQADLQSLADERQKYGSANVDAVLARESELTKNWEALLTQVWGGRK